MALAAAAAKGLSLPVLRRARALWAEDVQTVTLRELWGGQDAGRSNEVLFARRTHQQLKVRIAHRLRDFLFLPYKAMADPAVRCLYDKYVATYNMHEDFRELKTQEDVAQYWVGLAETFVEHQNVISLLGIGRRRIVRLDAGLAEVFDNFLRRFFVSRIGTHLLGSAFFHQVHPPPGVRKPAGVAMGVLQPTNPYGLLTDLVSSFRSQYSEEQVPVEIQGDPDTSILYVPNHLYGILREVLQNALRESAAQAKAGAKPLISVRVNHGQLGMFVIVSDTAGGVADVDQVWQWGEDPALIQMGPDEKDEWEDPEALFAEADLHGKRTTVLPLGFGLPLARLTAQYFGGDLRLQTVVGHGTNAYIHIPELQQESDWQVEA